MVPSSFIPHFASVEMACQRQEPDIARYHAEQVTALATQLAIPYLRVAAQACSGLAKSASRDFEGSVIVYQEGLSYARKVRAGLDFEARLLADLADAYFRAGHYAKAADVAAEAIDVARRRTYRVSECHACVIRAAALMKQANSHFKGEVAGLIARAQTLVQLTGASRFGLLITEIEAASQSSGL